MLQLPKKPAGFDAAKMSNVSNDSVVCLAASLAVISPRILPPHAATGGL